MANLMMWTPSGWEMGIILIVGLLLFGKRLPEVGRSMGKGIVEFKRGLKDIGDEVDRESSKPAKRSESLPDESRAAQVDPPMSATGEEVRVSRSDAVE